MKKKIIITYDEVENFIPMVSWFESLIHRGLEDEGLGLTERNKLVSKANLLIVGIEGAKE